MATKPSSLEVSPNPNVDAASVNKTKWSELVVNLSQKKIRDSTVWEKYATFLDFFGIQETVIHANWDY